MTHEVGCSSESFQLKQSCFSTAVVHQLFSMTTSRTPIERDARVLQLYEQLIEIEQRLVPTGLHVFGRAAELQEKADLLRMVASFDRPEHGARSLPALVAEGLGVHSYEQLLHETPSSEMKELIDKIVKDAEAL